MIALLRLAASARAAVQTHGDVGQNGFDKRLSSFGVDVYRPAERKSCSLGLLCYVLQEAGTSSLTLQR